MNLNESLLSRLASATPPQRADELQRLLDSREDNSVGLMLLDRTGRVGGLVIASLETFATIRAHPGALLCWPVWAGVEEVVAFHTRRDIAVELTAADLQFCQRLVDFAGVLGLSLRDHILFGLRPEWVSLRSTSPGHWPKAADPEVIATWPAPREPLAPRYRDWISGETWAGRGTQPLWLQEALEMDLKLADFELVNSSDKKELAGQAPPRGAELVEVMLLPDQRPSHRQLEFDGISAIKVGPVVSDEPSAVAASLYPLLDSCMLTSAAGALFWNREGQAIEPIAGYWSSLEGWSQAPGRLFSRGLSDTAVKAVTFSWLRDRRNFNLSGVEEHLFRSWALSGQLMGVDVVDHLAINSDGDFRALRQSSLFRWPATDAIRYMPWPPT